jgi:DNA-directed RNA polymerase omega subunit
MIKTEHTEKKVGDDQRELDHAVDSNFRLILVAALRSKQLLNGAQSRINADPLRRKNTSIALEEVRRGLVPFSIIARSVKGEEIGAA